VPCADFNSRRLRAQLLRQARASVPDSPEVRFGSPLFKSVTASDPLRQKVALAGERWRSMGDDKQPVNLALLGSTGVCKTFVALAIANRILDAAEDPSLAMSTFERARGLRWAKVRDLLAAARRHRLGAGDVPAIADATRASILVLDELGFEQRPRDGEQDVLFELLDARYTARRTTIVTSGRSIAGIIRVYGEALKRRITDRGTVIEAFRPNDPEIRPFEGAA
jgi:DNA replication protein DnaC